MRVLPRLLRALPYPLWPLLLLACLALPFATRALPFTDGIERAIHDLYRFALAPTVPEEGSDPDIAIVTYDDAVARASGKLNPVDRATLAEALGAIEGAGAKAIAIDMIFTLPTKDQQVLIDRLRSMTIPVYLAYADPERDRVTYWAPEVDSEARPYQDSFFASLAGGKVEPVSPAVGTDEAGIARRWPRFGEGGKPPLAFAMADLPRQSYSGGIGFTRLTSEAAAGEGVEYSHVFPTLPMDLTVDPDLADIFLPTLTGKYVLVGADTFNDDQHATPITRIAGDVQTPGVTIHAQMLRQALDGRFPVPLSSWLVALVAALATIAGVASAMIERRAALLWALALAQFATLAALPLALKAANIDYLGLPLFGFALSWLLAFVTVGYALRSRTSIERAFARGALGKFLPEKVAKQILDQPALLDLTGEQRDLCMMFTDLEGFTRFSHGREPQATAAILNRYLEQMSGIVLDHGGTLDKYVGDALVAFWGAPIASDDDAEQCVACAMALHAASERLRAEIAAEYGDTLGRTRIGLHCGSVVVGNFGGTRRIQYTALGDAMNIAARLEGANKYLGSDILASGQMRARAPNFAWRPLGRVAVSGVDTALDLCEPVAGERAAYTGDWIAAMGQAERGDDAGAHALRKLASAHPGDAALQALAGRLDAIAGGGIHALESK
ncbi:adenylate/guanylate cyclase domain-containing protein [Parerythrobacter aestuarii]|uniref:adenylate/guanylate cyclase domain-containing protein n=1 Tax=Parerythrobacter aestuarii TaxID=3020909 RepID=UPI0024DE5A28|nr:adenylate/guanylate cyclase domain-containing protein [Parerythrobacter aestuarii]